MLLQGPYPWPLKQRIKSRSGHLSNSDARQLLQELRHDGLEHVVLAHLSEVNNTPQKALSEVGLAFTNCRAQLTVAAQDVCGSMFEIHADYKEPH
jgi:phosphoribosyl 1,2-cyclic phosphodiesterase